MTYFRRITENARSLTLDRGLHSLRAAVSGQFAMGFARPLVEGNGHEHCDRPSTHVIYGVVARLKFRVHTNTCHFERLSQCRTRIQQLSTITTPRATRSTLLLTSGCRFGKLLSTRRMTTGRLYMLRSSQRRDSTCSQMRMSEI